MPTMSKPRGIFIAVVIVGAVYKSSQPQRTFLPPAGRSVRPSLPTATMSRLAATGAAAAMINVDPATAYQVDPGQVEKSARVFADAAYPLMQKIDWVGMNPVVPYLEQAPWDSAQLGNALKKVLQAGIEMDPELVRKAVIAHEKALRTVIDGGKIIATKEDVEEIFVNVARLASSAGDDKMQAVYDAVQPIGADKFNAAMMEFLGGPAEVGGAYNTFLDTMGAASKALRA